MDRPYPSDNSIISSIIGSIFLDYTDTIKMAPPKAPRRISHEPGPENNVHKKNLGSSAGLSLSSFDVHNPETKYVSPELHRKLIKCKEVYVSLHGYVRTELGKQGSDKSKVKLTMVKQGCYLKVFETIKTFLGTDRTAIDLFFDLLFPELSGSSAAACQDKILVVKKRFAPATPKRSSSMQTLNYAPIPVPKPRTKLGLVQ